MHIPHLYTEEEIIKMYQEVDKDADLEKTYVWVALHTNGTIHDIAPYDDRKRLKKRVKHYNENNKIFPLRVVKCKLVEVKENKNDGT